MKPATIGWTFVLVVLGAAFFFGMGEVVRLRTDVSDAFPDYSTYRADPQGTQVLFRALTGVPDLRVERNERDLGLFKGGPESALFLLGAFESPDPKKLIEHLEKYVIDGGRLVLTFGMRGHESEYTIPEYESGEARGDEQTAEERIKDLIAEKDVPAVTPPEEKQIRRGQVLTTERWGFRVVAPMSYDEFQDSGPLTASPVDGSTFAKATKWTSPEYFAVSNPKWETIYTVPGDPERPVMIRRPFGKGDIIVASDTYFLSNEAMRYERQPALLSWLIEGKQRVVFEETTKGVDRTPGIVGLMKRYNLHILMGMALLLAVLYVWRGSVSLLPRRSEEQERERAAILLGRDAHSGLAALLRRAAPPDQVLRVCFDEWQQAFGRTHKASNAAVAEARRILTAGYAGAGALPAEVLQRYRAAAALLRERRSAP